MLFSTRSFLTTLALGCVGGLVHAPASAQVSANHATNAMTAGAEGYNVYRIPGFAVADDGSLLLFAEGRPSQSDPGAPGDIDLVYKRSTDGGQTWSPLTVLHQRSDFDFSDPRVVIDEVTGDAHMLYVQWPTLSGQTSVPVGLGDNSSVTYVQSSSDHGATWSGPININTQVKDPTWASLNTGPGLGIQLKWQDADPSRNGRLVIPAHHRPTAYRGVAIYSDDGGATWSSGSSSTPHYADESEIVELTNGDLLWDARINGSGRRRSISTDGGQTWTDTGSSGIPVSAVDTGMARYSAKRDGQDRDRILYSAPLGSPAGAGNDRDNIGVWTSYDEGKTFINPVVIESGSAAYSVIDRLDDGSIGLIYEVNHDTVRYVNFDLAQLESGTHSADLSHYDGFDNTVDPSKGGVGWSGGWQADGGVGYNGGYAPVNFDGSQQFDLGFSVSMAAGGGGTNTIDPGIAPNERANGIYGQVFTTQDQAGAVTQVTVQRADSSTASPDSVYLHVYTDLDPTDGITPGTFLGSSLTAQSMNPTDSGITTWSFDGASAVLAPNTQYFFGFANSPTPGDITTTRAGLFEVFGNEGGILFAPNIAPGSLPFDNGGTPLTTAGDHLQLEDQTISRELGAGAIDLDQAGTYYASVLVSRAADAGPDNATDERLGFQFQTAGGSNVFGFGVNSAESFFIEGIGSTQSTPADALDPASTYLLLMKIISQDSTGGNTDQLFVKAFASGSALPSTDSGLDWDLVGDTDTNLDELITQLAITSGSSSVWSMDELRLGSTFESVITEGSTRYSLSYDASTGELEIDTLGGTLINYVLQGAGFVEENHTFVLTNGVGNSSDDVISESSLIPSLGVLSLGGVLPANLSPAAFAAYFSSHEYITSLGTPKTPFELVYVGLPADLDGDGDVDDADFGLAFAAFTGPGNGPPSNTDADLDGDGDVDDADFGIAFAGFTGPGAPANVPEPTTLALLGLLGGLTAMRRRRTAVSPRRANPPARRCRNVAVPMSTIGASIMSRQVLLAAMAPCIVAYGTAAQLSQRHSSLFDLRYEMDVSPSNVGAIDLDNNGISDWFDGIAGGFAIPAVGSGIAASDQNTGQTLFRTDFGGSIQRNAILGDYTLEVAVRVNADGNGRDADDVGYFGLALDHVNDTDSLRLNIDASAVSFDFDGNGVITTADNTDAFHVFRIAYDTSGGSDDYHIWRDGVSLGGPFAPGNGNANSNGVFFLGDFTGSLSGEWEVDYIRIDSTGAFAPLTSIVPGDTDGDGDIDDTDLLTAFSNYTGSLAPGIGDKSAADGDTDGDGDVDDIDIGTAFENYTGTLALVNVPEPGALVCIVIGGGMLVRRRSAQR